MKQLYTVACLLGILIGSVLIALYQAGKPTTAATHYPFTLPALPYADTALEPYIDTLTMQLHHDKHHQTYVDNLNKALALYPALHQQTLEELLGTIETLPAAIQAAVRNNGGGHYNHSLFWLFLSPTFDQQPSPALQQAIVRDFGSLAKFKQEFTIAAQQVFGSGWAWLVQDAAGKLRITTTANQDVPFAQGTPLLCLDVWEHAYYLKHQNKRPAYIDDWWHLVNWQEVARRFKG
ncbi:superoxide dismutase [Candidatus Dependentiae bacterium]|nr:superoxide dismutase [Candidatus Dependentiae bacterium]